VTGVQTCALPISGFAPGSEIVLTFLEPADQLPQASQDKLAELSRRVAEVGEPFVSYYTPQEIEASLLGAGFTQAGLLAADEAQERYFRGRPADLPVPTRTSLAWARR
jgi:O-methyltransferase involved in polyketide biosynthesis